jgi:predicted MFS family arabinose efflux permease
MAQSTVQRATAWAPFRHRTFTVIWISTVVSNIGGWMSSAASGWLMTSLDSSPLLVAMVQVASSLPMFLLALPAGALSDIVDRRRFLIAGELSIMAAAIVLAVLVSRHLITPLSLLGMTFIVSVGSAMTTPAWQAVVTVLVPKSDLPSAIALNSAGVNVSRAVGPALGGVLVSAFGIAAPFWIDAFSNAGVILGLASWRAPRKERARLPPEGFSSAIRAGLRHARYNPHLTATLMRAAAFFLFASAYWALLPLVARQQIESGPALYGVLLGAIGVGAVSGAFALPWLKARLGADWLLASGTIGTAAAALLFGISRTSTTALAASLLAGVSWIASLSSLNVSAQVALPEWVRGRGLAVFVTVLFGAMSLGSSVWGEVGMLAGVSPALFLAAAGALIAIPLTWRWKLQTGAGVDFSPSMHWPAPITTHDVEQDRGPVLVTVEYHIDPKNRAAFLRALGRYAQERRRDGAYEWGLFEDPAREGRFVETFLTDSWLEHLRAHERVTKADRKLEQVVSGFLLERPPRTTHLIAVRPGGVSGGGH